MTWAWVVVGLMLMCAGGPALLFALNLRRYLPPPPTTGTAAERVAVLVPARNEEANIGECLQAVLASEGVSLEVAVLDDASSDRTASMVAGIAAADPRVRLLQSLALPEGWNGKQSACWQLAQATDASLLLFLDADVRIAPDAIARCVAALRERNVALVSGFPRLVTVGLLEWLLLPLIHFVLLGFLPIGRMRASTDPALAAGCGQFMLVAREAYFASGGHAAIRATMHDGLLLPRAFRRAGFRTDLVDLTDLAHVRMYQSAAAVWNGLAKNATEGLAAPARIVPLTALLLLGQVLPLVAGVLCGMAMVSVMVVGAVYDHPRGMALFYAFVGVAVVCSFLPRLLAVGRFRQPLKSALLHPVGMTLLLCVQWYALARQLLGRPVGWRARAYAPGSGEQVR